MRTGVGTGVAPAARMQSLAEARPNGANDRGPTAGVAVETSIIELVLAACEGSEDEFAIDIEIASRIQTGAVSLLRRDRDAMQRRTEPLETPRPAMGLPAAHPLAR